MPLRVVVSNSIYHSCWIERCFCYLVEMSVDIVENSYGMQREIACEVTNRNTSAICSKLTNQSAQRLTCSNADRDATSCCAADYHATCRYKTSCSNTDRYATSCYATSSYATSSYYMQFETRFWGLCVSRQILPPISPNATTLIRHRNNTSWPTHLPHWASSALSYGSPMLTGPFKYSFSWYRPYMHFPMFQFSSVRYTDLHAFRRIYASFSPPILYVNSRWRRSLLIEIKAFNQQSKINWRYSTWRSQVRHFVTRLVLSLTDYVVSPPMGCPIKFRSAWSDKGPSRPLN
jgi:hypothetical protein